MKSQTPLDGADADQRITALVGEFFDRRQAGEALTPEEFAREHQDVAEQLRSHLAGVPLIEQACGLTTGLGGSGSAAVNLPEVPGFELMEEIGRGFSFGDPLGGGGLGGSLQGPADFHQAHRGAEGAAGGAVCVFGGAAAV